MNLVWASVQRRVSPPKLGGNTLGQTLSISDSYVSVSKMKELISAISYLQKGKGITGSYCCTCCPFYASK